MKHPYLKKLELHSAPPPSERQIIALLSKSAEHAADQAYAALHKFGKVSNLAGHCMFKSTVPATRQGKRLAETRNNISRTNLYLRALLED